MRTLKPKALWFAASAVLMGAALACFEQHIRATVAEETDAGSWERAIADEKANADGVSGNVG